MNRPINKEQCILVSRKEYNDFEEALSKGRKYDELKNNFEDLEKRYYDLLAGHTELKKSNVLTVNVKAKLIEKDLKWLYDHWARDEKTIDEQCVTIKLDLDQSGFGISNRIYNTLLKLKNFVETELEVMVKKQLTEKFKELDQVSDKNFRNVEKYIDEHNSKPWYKRCEKLDKFKVWDNNRRQ